MTQPFYRYPGATNADVYELENTIVDPSGRIEAHMESLAPMAGKTVLDIGAGGGFHATRFAARAARVFAVEPDPNMRAQLFARLAAPDAPRAGTPSSSTTTPTRACSGRSAGTSTRGGPPPRPRTGPWPSTPPRASH